MKYETEHASAFWSTQLHPRLGKCLIIAFETELLRLMCNKFANHWYEEEPIRGQAYREVTCDPEGKWVDELLLRAASNVGFSFFDYYIPTKGLRMWIDPGEVEVTYTEAPYHTQIIYKRTNQSLSVSPPQSPSQELESGYYYHPDYYIIENEYLY